MIGIRVDANEKIAMGHLMRCIAIAKELKRLNQQVIFIISEEYSEKFISESGFRCICLSNHYNEKNMEIEKIIAIIKSERINALLLDSYEVTYDYMAAIKKYSKLIYIDDINSFRYPVDVIVNYTYKTEQSVYTNRGYNQEIFLLGSDYVPLRKEFSQKEIEIKEEVQRIFLTTGGTDEYNMLIGVLEKLQLDEWKKIEKHIVTGKFYRYTEQLKRMAIKDSSIVIYNNISNICEIMRKCDMAVSAGGTTLAELSACGIPTVCFSVADNQLSGTKAYSEAKLMLYAGDAREKREEVLQAIAEQLTVLKHDILLRKHMGIQAKKVIDGQGAYRIANEIVKLVERG